MGERISKAHPRQPNLVIDRNGRRGTIALAATVAGDTAGDARGQAAGRTAEDIKQVFVNFDNGERLLVPRDLLHEEADGHYRLPLSIEIYSKHKWMGKRWLSRCSKNMPL